METKRNFDYDNISDSLIISCKKNEEIIKENFVFDNFIISLTQQGKIAVIEILDISDYLIEMGFNPLPWDRHPDQKYFLFWL